MLRTGATLVEVLVAIFVMGLGMIALLTLFPLGALRMAQAIQDDRCTSAVHCADTIATLKNIRNDPLVRTPQWLGAGDIFRTRLLLGQAQVTYADYDTGANPVATVPNRPPPIALYYDGPSFPVYVDPFGFQALNIPAVNPYQSSQFWVGYGGGGNYLGGNVGGVLARTTPSFLGGPLGINTYKWFTLVDDHQFQSSFGNEGKANIPGTGVIRRDIRYSWAYLLQRPKSSDPSVVNCTVVVYNRRPLGLTLASPLSGVQAASLGETAYNAIYSLTNSTVPTSAGKINVPGNSITIDTRIGSQSTFAPSVRVGDWLLDTTLVKADLYEVTNPASGTLQPINPPAFGPALRTAHANFYRVTSVTPKSDSVFVCEVQQPIRDFTVPSAGIVPPNRPPSGVKHAVINSYFDFATNNFTPATAASTFFNGGVMVLEGVADVYERGLDRKFD